MEENSSEGEGELVEAGTGNESEHGGGPINEDSDSNDDGEEQPFDIALAASHSYMGAGMTAVPGRLVLEAGWRGRVPAWPHHGVVFPGETVPVLRVDEHHAPDAHALKAIHKDKLFGLLCPDETGTMVSGYGVLCEVFEACVTRAGGAGGAGAGLRAGDGAGGGLRAGDGAGGGLRAAGGAAGGEEALTRTFKARATHRFRLLSAPKNPLPLHSFERMRFVDVQVLPEVAQGEPLWPARLGSLDVHRRGSTQADRRLRSFDAALTPWPLFVFDIFDYERMRDYIVQYFSQFNLTKLPADAVSLSFWVASNLALSARDRLKLFVVDSALLRLHMEVRLIARRSALCCSVCKTEIARREHIIAMSSEGVHSNYTNLGGYMHDIVTVTHTVHTVLEGASSAEYSWFPGYAWSIALCRACTQHVGWRFDALKRNLRPQQFYALCRNTVQPRADPVPDPLADAEH